MKKKIWVIILGSFLAVLAAFSYGLARHYAMIPPILKPIDPDNHFFNPDNFRFNDYLFSEGYVESSLEYYKKLFPVGTPKEKVDRIFIEAGDAGSSQSKDYPEIYFYAEPRKGLIGGRSNYMVIYQDGKLRNIRIKNFFGYLYPDQITRDDLTNVNEHKRKLK